MRTFRSRLIQLHQCQGCTWKVMQSFLIFDPTLQSIYDMSATQLRQFGLSNEQAGYLYEDLHYNHPWRLSHFKAGDIRVLTRFDEAYPEQLSHIYDAPWVIYCIGNTNLLHQNQMLSVVGSRNHSPNACNVMKQILTPLLSSGWTIVSGLALGIDTLAHQLALEHGAGTIAVLGGGFRSIYPKENELLASTIARDGLLLSEYPPNRRPEKHQFPERNRIISGLSPGTFIIEAQKRSGSLITADQAMEQGREVFCLPGNIAEPYAEGTNRLIQQGAKLVLEAKDILNELSNFHETDTSTI
ncbi:DNA-processing protein DprA [Pseudalkalibacillus hwajinpoensis]|uniref:DNA-processing protein DprA n=1 Tax=Guptibacillus hwajinpoensis TaxID=208199 RepID=UPI001CFDB29D|nr:DNA-processing protein DprA [Pseudalkalibacillus hwajinpoensis]